MTELLDKQAGELHRILGDLVRRYHFRDKQEICCHGISVSQCYTLAALEEKGQLNMGELSERMQLTVSTMTRAIDQLVDKELVVRCMDPTDRRVCCVELTVAGRVLWQEIHGDIIEMEKGILNKIGPQERENVIKALGELTRAVAEWRKGCG